MLESLMVLSRVVRTASWSMEDLPLETESSSRGMCQMVSSSSGWRKEQCQRTAYDKEIARTYSRVSGGEETVLSELEAVLGLLDGDDGEADLWEGGSVS